MNEELEGEILRAVATLHAAIITAYHQASLRTRGKECTKNLLRKRVMGIIVDVAEASSLVKLSAAAGALGPSDLCGAKNLRCLLSRIKLELGAALELERAEDLRLAIERSRRTFESALGWAKVAGQWSQDARTDPNPLKLERVDS